MSELRTPDSGLLVREALLHWRCALVQVVRLVRLRPGPSSLDDESLASSPESAPGADDRCTMIEARGSLASVGLAALLTFLSERGKTGRVTATNGHWATGTARPARWP
jgi:hypothetical protein